MRSLHIICERILICRDEISEGKSSCERIFICKDEISGGESSLRENFIRRDEISIAEGPAFSELPFGEI